MSSTQNVAPTDGFLVRRAQAGDERALGWLVKRYYGFVRLKASSYFLAGGDDHDLIQEGLVGLHKAIRDYRPGRGSGFRNFADLCITRQIITAVKTATRNKHQVMNTAVSLHNPAPRTAPSDNIYLHEAIPSTRIAPDAEVISSEELQSLVGMLSTQLSEMESRVLSLYLDGLSYQQIAERIGVDTKKVDNALQRVKRKVGIHLAARYVAA